MYLYIVNLQDDEETLLFVKGDNEDEVRRQLRKVTSTNYHIRGIVATQCALTRPFDDIFMVDIDQLEKIPC